VAQQGQTLTLIPGQWNETPAPTLTEQWAQCDTDGANCVAINGATASSYVPVASDVGHTLSVLETATNAISTATASSPPTAVILPPAPSPTSAPSITGVLAQGNVLTGEHGGWTNSPSSLIDAWFRCDAAGANCGPISGAVSQPYTLTAADVGATLVALETATNSGGSGSAFSAATGVITAAAPVIPVPINGSPPTIAGSTLQG
jgi:hypothetical protein